MTLASLFLIGSFSTTEILLILSVIILLFGAKRIPELARGLGKGIREFQDATKEIRHGIESTAPSFPVVSSYPTAPLQSQPLPHSAALPTPAVAPVAPPVVTTST